MSLSRCGLLLAAVAAGVVLTPALFALWAFLQSTFSHAEPEGGMAIAFLVAFPVAVFLGGAVTGLLTRIIALSPLSPSAVFLLTPGLYQSLIAFVASRIIPDFGPVSIYQLITGFPASPYLIMIVLSYLGLLAGYKLRLPAR